MILRPLHHDLLLLITLILSLGDGCANANPAFDCHVKVDQSTYDLTKAAGEFTANRTRETPPSAMFDFLRFNLCADLKALEGVAEQDQCSPGTRACLTKTNKKPNEPDRVTAVIPIVQSQNLKPEFKASSSPKYISILLNGPEYPSPLTSTPTPQFLNLTFFCDPDKFSDPKFISYDGSRLDLEWSGPAGCPFKEEGDKPNDDKKEEGGGGGDKNQDKDKETEGVGSGIGWFFMMLLLALVAYFAFGAYYNYSTYGARGTDLIPHRDFWQEVPYMLSDVVSHLCSTVRPRRTSSRGGYIAV